jgi:hypothetical protein
MHHAIGIGLLIYLIAYAFGNNVARTVVGGSLLLCAAAFAYIMFRIISGTI